MIGNIPIVLKIRIAINHTSWLFLPDFQRAMPFQIASQMINGIKTKVNHAGGVYGVNISLMKFCGLKNVFIINNDKELAISYFNR